MPSDLDGVTVCWRSSRSLSFLSPSYFTCSASGSEADSSQLCRFSTAIREDDVLFEEHGVRG